jgi:hypothetical protein
MRHLPLVAAVLACLTLAGCASAPDVSTPDASIPGGTPSSTAPAAPAQSAAPSASSHTAPGRAGSPAGCDASLWQHIYHPYRLRVVIQCTTVTGTVKAVEYEPDGDVHIRVAVAASLVNQANDTYQDGDLVAEVICYGTVTQADAVTACQGYRNTVTIPAPGDTVRVTGSYVLDADHGWMEVHPVSRIVVTGHTAAAAPGTAPSTPAPATTAAAASGCYPKTPSGGCYEPGEFCSRAEHGETGVAGDGKTIVCRDIGYTTWHWEPT